MIMCVLLCYPVSIHMFQLLSTERPISSLNITEDMKFYIAQYKYKVVYSLPLQV